MDSRDKCRAEYAAGAGRTRKYMDNTSIVGLWDRVFGTQPDPDMWLIVVTALIALAAVLPHGVWRLSRNAVTIAHEGGHGLVALLSGRQLAGIRLHSDTSGL